MYKFENLNQALIGMSQELIRNGVKRKTRGFDCVEISHPVLICIDNPSDRYVTIKERKWNSILPFVESLWMAMGLNNLDVLPGNYVKNLYKFSDDGKTWRAGYGPRLRFFSGHNSDYNISKREYGNIHSGLTVTVDQLKFVVDSIKKDINTRQALITIHDPAKDDFENGELKITKDQPCTRSLHFQVNSEGELDLSVHIRSNDLLWGFSAVNVTNFTIMQEYVASILGLKIGKYYHFADNLHFYENFLEKIEIFASLNLEDYGTGEKFQYKNIFRSLEEFDELLDELYNYEQSLRSGKVFLPIAFSENDLFHDWALVLHHHHTKEKIIFINPYLTKLFNK